MGSGDDRIHQIGAKLACKRLLWSGSHDYVLGDIVLVNVGPFGSAKWPCVPRPSPKAVVGFNTIVSASVFRY